MPPLPGDERLLTLFADVHYYFSQPVRRPATHRFDKASYFYIYYNSTRQTSRIEIANNPGTDDQDAFAGYLDKCRITNSHKFPTLVTIEVEAVGAGSSPISPSIRDPDEWRLASADPRATRADKYKLHTLDVYFWTQEDAKLAVGFFKKLLQPAQLNITTANPPSQQNARGHDVISPVVQNLENVAISDPAYQDGKTRNSQNQPQTIPANLPPPPPLPSQAPKPTASALSNSSTTSWSERTETPRSDSANTNFTPLAYNPAAPAAPEAIKHREKTPPPLDGVEGTGLAQAATHDSGYRPGPPSSLATSTVPSATSSQYGHYGSPPAPSTISGYGSQISSSGYGSPPPSSLQQQQQQQQLQSHTSIGSQSLMSSTGYGSPPPHQQPARSSLTSQPMSFAPPPTNPAITKEEHRLSSAAEQYTPQQAYQPQPAETPGTEFYNTIPHESKPLQHVQPKYPEYFPQSSGSPAYPAQPQGQQQQPQYNTHLQQQQPQQQYNNPYQPNPLSGNEYGIHQQVYVPEQPSQHSHRPSSGNHGGIGGGRPPKNDSKASVTSRVDEKASKLIGKFQKRFG